MSKLIYSVTHSLFCLFTKKTVRGGPCLAKWVSVEWTVSIQETENDIDRYERKSSVQVCGANQKEQKNRK